MVASFVRVEAYILKLHSLLECEKINGQIFSEIARQHSTVLRSQQKFVGSDDKTILFDYYHGRLLELDDCCSLVGAYYQISCSTERVIG